MAFLAIVGEELPDFRTISLFRKNHLDAFADVFVQVLCLAKAAGLVRLGTIAIDGTKVQGNASRHKAMSYGYMTQEVARLRAEINESQAGPGRRCGRGCGLRWRGVGMSCPRNCVGGRTAWRRSKRR